MDTCTATAATTTEALSFAGDKKKTARSRGPFPLPHFPDQLTPTALQAAATALYSAPPLP